MQSFFARLQDRASDVNSLLCVGLDPHPELLPEVTPEAARNLCMRIVKECSPYACAFKPNSAFFEAFGPDGMAVLMDVVAAVPDGIPVILDSKRGDISSTAESYAQSIFEVLGAHAVTASPYLGADSLAPFLARPECGVFVLCKTSNPGADNLQTLRVGAQPVYLHVAHQAQTWSQHDNLGLVVGATDPQALAQVREAAPNSWLLVPGIGAQGGDLAATIRAGLRSDHLGMLINASRSIASAVDPAAAAAQLRDAINSERVSSVPTPQRGNNEKLAATLVDAGCIIFGDFTLKSGHQSPFYIDLRRLASFPLALHTIAAAFQPMLDKLNFDCVAAIPYAGLPIGTAVTMAGDWPLIYVRRETKQHGTLSRVEGVFQTGDTAVVLDDLITTGESKFETIETLSTHGIRVRDIAVLIDREQGAAATLTTAGYRLHAVITIRELLMAWRQSADFNVAQYETVSAYLASNI